MAARRLRADGHRNGFPPAGRNDFLPMARVFDPDLSIDDDLDPTLGVLLPDGDDFLIDLPMSGRLAPDNFNDRLMPNLVHFFPTVVRCGAGARRTQDQGCEGGNQQRGERVTTKRAQDGAIQTG